MLRKENIWYMLNRLVNHPHNNPFIAFTEILNYIESYDNPILVIMETFHYATIISMNIIGSRVSRRK